MAHDISPRGGEILLYTGATRGGGVRVEVLFKDESFWLAQKRMAELFDVTVPTISHHLKEIFDSGELTRDPTVRNFRTVQTEGTRRVTRDMEFYNLDTIIAVGYRVNSRQATQFRIWAPYLKRNKQLKQTARSGGGYVSGYTKRLIWANAAF